MKSMHHAARNSVFALLAAIMTFSYAGITKAEETYVFDKRHTEIRFTWDHFGLARTAAFFREYDGELVFDAAAPEKSALDVTINAKSVYVISLGAETFLTKPEWFDADMFPDITFKATKIEKTGEKTGKITGDLTIKGVTQPVTLDVTLNFKGEHPFSKKPSLGFSASGKVKRSDFGMGNYAPAISDEVLIEIQTEFNIKG